MFDGFLNGFSSILCILIVGFAMVNVAKIFLYIHGFEKNSENHISVRGKIENIAEVEKMKLGREVIETAYPVYGCTIDGIKRMSDGIVRLPVKELSVGKELSLVYDKRTGKVWNISEIAVMKKQILIKMILVIVLVIAAIVIPILL